MVNLHQFPVPLEGIRYQNPDVDVVIDKQELGKGTLYVAESCMCWISPAGDGFRIEYPKMVLHAISTNSEPSYLYVMVNGYLDEVDGQADMVADVEPDEISTEIRFIPENQTHDILVTMYGAVQACTLLHPDPDSEMSDESEEGEVDLNEEFEGYEAGGEGDLGDAYEDDEVEELDNGFQRMMARFGGGDGKDRGPPDAGDAPFDPDQFADAD